MLKHKYAAAFINAMIKEADDHDKCKHWKVLHSWDQHPGVKSILAICAFRGKSFPDGRINKHREQHCALGVMQQYGVNY